MAHGFLWCSCTPRLTFQCASSQFSQIEMELTIITWERRWPPSRRKASSSWDLELLLTTWGPCIPRALLFLHGLRSLILGLKMLFLKEGNFFVGKFLAYSILYYVQFRTTYIYIHPVIDGVFVELMEHMHSHGRGYGLGGRAMVFATITFSIISSSKNIWSWTFSIL